MAIPTITKDYLPEKVINLVQYERKYGQDPLTDEELDVIIEDLNPKAVGFALGYILYEDQVETETWTNIKELYITWKLLDDVTYAEDIPDLVEEKYTALIDLLTNIRRNQESKAINQVGNEGIKTRGLFVFNKNSPYSN